MPTNYQNASMLDMIFENRNKHYGAYVLRRDYNQSITKAILVMMTSLFLLGFGHFLGQKMKKSVTGFIQEETFVDVMPPIEFPKEPEEIEPPKPTQPEKSQPIPTQQRTEMNVIADNNRSSDSIPTVEQMQDIDPGIATNVNTGNTIGVTDGTGDKATINSGSEQVFTVGWVRIAEKMPQYPGGETELMKFLAKNTSYPESLIDIGIDGKVLSEFTVDEQGKVTDIKIVKSPHPFFDKEVMKVVKMLPDFTPGMQQGRPVKVRLSLPFTFKSN